MKTLKPIFTLLFILFSCCISYAQSQIFDVGSFGNTCPNGGGNSCSSAQQNYDVTANTVTGDIYLLKREYIDLNLFYKDRLIRYNAAGNRLTDFVLPTGTYKKTVADNGTGVFVLSVRNDSVIVTRYDQNSLALSWSTGVYNGAAAPEAFDIIIAFGSIYFGSNDANGMHLYKLNKNTGNILASNHYNTVFASTEHGLDLDASTSAIFVAGYFDEPGTLNGDELFLAKFTTNLGFSYQKRYNYHLALTNNSDRASHVHTSNDTVFVTGTVTTGSGNVNAILLKYAHNGTLLWKKIIDKGLNDHTVDCAVDNSNGDIYLLQNATNNASVSKIFVTRLNSAGTQQWAHAYVSTDTTASQPTLGYNIHADPNPGGGGCEIYISGQRQDFAPDPHGYVYGLNLLFYKLNRSGAYTSIINVNACNTGGGCIAPLNRFTKSVYYPNYTGGPKLILISDADYSNPFPGIYGWRLMLYNISSTARLTDAQADQETFAFQSDLLLTPNPANDITVLKAAEPIEAVNIFSLTGQLTAQYKSSTNEVLIDVKHFQKGIYFIEAIINKKPVYTRLAVQ